MMNFTSCCCRYSLKTGSIVVGVVSAAASLGALTAAVALALASTSHTWMDGQRWAERARAVHLPEADVQQVLHEDFSSLSFVSDNIRVFLNLFGVVEAFHFHFSIILLYGIWKEKPEKLLLWVLVSVTAITLRVLNLLPIIVQVLMADFVGLGATMLVLAVFSIPLAVYFMLIVNSYRRKMVMEIRIKKYTSGENALRFVTVF